MSTPSTTQTVTPGPAVDEELRRATIAVLRERGWSGLTLERVAEVAGRARSTLWRQGLSREVLVGALLGELADDFRSTMYPVLTSGGSGRDRLVRGLEALCELLERHLPLMLATENTNHKIPLSNAVMAAARSTPCRQRCNTIGSASAYAYSGKNDTPASVVTAA